MVDLLAGQQEIKSQAARFVGTNSLTRDIVETRVEVDAYPAATEDFLEDQ